MKGCVVHPFVFKGENMKCTCPKHPVMIEKSDEHNNHWWECPVCHREVGKPKDEEES